MRTRHVALMLCILLLSTCFLGIGYATLSTTLSVEGITKAEPPKQVYISSIEPPASAGVSIVGTSGTTMRARVTGGGKATFSVTVINPTTDIYVFERVIDGAETGVEGVYNGTAITYSTSGITPLITELPAGGGKVTFDVSITVPTGVTAEQYVLLFNFLPKGSIEILPDGTKYEVTFKPNNGDADQMIEVDKDKQIPRPADPVRDGYTFTGWYKDPGCLSPWSFETETVTANVILYAGWKQDDVVDPEPPAPPEVIQYEVIFEYYNGDSDYVILVDEGSLIPKPVDPTRDGYTFTGWYKDVDCLNPWNFETERVTVSVMLHAGWKSNSGGSNSNLVGDFAGLVIALLAPETNNGINNSSVIYNALRTAMNNGKRPSGHAPILHSSVRSISGGTMSDVASQANAKLNNELEFFFEADPDSADRVFLYMYYADEIKAAQKGDQIVVYKQVMLRGEDDEWAAGGTYLGYATVGDFYGGGNNGKTVRTVDAYSWKAGKLPTA